MVDTKKLLVEMGQRIFERRKYCRMTQEELAEKIDVTPQMISTAELGKKAIRPENLLKISIALDVSADFLLSGESINKDILYLQTKLELLSPEKFVLIQNIISSCIKLSENEFHHSSTQNIWR